MEDIKRQYTLSLYEEITNFNENKKSRVFLVKNIQDNKIYIKKILTQYNIEIFSSIKEVNSIHIPRIYEIIEENNQLIIIEEFINGLTLREILDKYKKIDEDLVIDYILQLCDVLEEIHNFNPLIIHRDIKPENIIISNDGVLKLIDFDASRTYKENENRDTELLGTLEYAAPEQFGFRQTDVRTDVYSIGILINVLLTGDVPRVEKCKGQLQDIVEKCINLDPKERYQNISMLKRIIKIKRSLKNSNENEYLEDSTIDINRVKDNNEIEREDKKSDKLLDIIPGFRTRRTWKMLCSSLFYLFLICGLGVYEEGFTFKEFRSNIALVIILLLLWLLYTNFYDLKNKLPIINSGDKYTRIVGYIIYTLSIIVIIGIIGDI